MTRFELLDHGYLDLVETWGSDQAIVEAARMSVDRGFLGWGPRCPHGNAFGECLKDAACASGTCKTKPGDEKLLRYLWEHEHSTPFEVPGITIEVKAPIMVFREWHRHRVPFGYSEMSARYVPLPDENYSPELQDILARSAAAATTANRQAAGTGVIATEPDALEWLAALADVYDHCQRVYEHGLRIGIPKELARLPVPVARYSRMRATANLRGWLGFMRLRAAPSAQKEIRVYAEALSEIVRQKFPRVHALWSEKPRFPKLKDAEFVQALRNVGVDAECGACMGIFYTGAANETHSCGKAA